MDLRKSVLLKQRNSNTSSYESAIEDSDNSIYYSFVDDSIKSVDSSLSERDENEMANSSTCSEDRENISMNSEDKENTVIMRQPDEIRNILGAMENHSTNSVRSYQEDDGRKSAVLTSGSKVLDRISEIVIEEAPALTTETEALMRNDRETSPDENMIRVLATTVKTPENTLERTEQDLPGSDIEIFVQDPSGQIVNPFTAPAELSRPMSIDAKPGRSSAPAVSSKPVVEKPVTRHSTLGNKIPSITHLYLPVLRKSLDRKPKAGHKSTPSRRTIHEAPKKADPSNKLGSRAPRTFFDATTQAASSSGAKAKTPTSIPKPIVKPKTNTCSVAGCQFGYSTLKALQDHQKTHKVTSNSPFACKWCDKKFQIETALRNHQTEKCTRIPFNEKRKFLAQRDKKEVDRRRTTLFVLPVPKRKSPSRKTAKEVSNVTLNKSGVKVTPKKSLKCHICSMIVPDAFTFANHVLSHKFRNETLNA